ncbi:microtubule-associated serine/threonine-protein kinase 3-like isoform X2 [Dysidea avara]|uniref:microtubule-associated serine/threonine-protein kinase 3-like isoform X2 n=1 Tax=Dysidea avara TaxID=196820 RepID=UPI00332AD4FC
MTEERTREFPKLLPNLISEVDACEEDDYYIDDDLDLNKTLPRNFKIHPVPMEDPTGGPKRSVSTQHIASSCNASTIGTLSRIHPVASPSSSLSNLLTISAELRKSDPSLHRKKASSFHMHSKSMDDRARLPVRAQSLYTKSQSPPFCSPRYSMITPSPCGSPHNMSPGMSSAFFYGRRDLDRGRRWSATSSGYSTTGYTDSPSSLSSYGSQEALTNQAFEDAANLSQQSSASMWSLMDEDTRPMKRSRARSLSPVRSSRNSHYELESLNLLFQDRFPKAKEQMEEKLQEFITSNEESGLHYSDGHLSFLRNQIIQHAKDLYFKSVNGLLSSQLFMELAASLDTFLHKVHEHTNSDDASLKKLIKQLLAIISRPARLLEVLDFNSEAYYQSLDETEHQLAKELLSSHVPFLLSRLKASLDSHSGDDNKNASDGTEPPDPTTPESSEPQSARSSVISTASSSTAPQLSNFERIKLISQGAYSSVYLVRHKQTKMRFAMKRLSKQRMIMKKQVQNIFQERDVLTVAENPFAVGLWCSFQTERSLYLVMEYVEGGDLGTLIKNIGSLPLDLARMYFAETVLALEYVHNLGIIHRDLKPDNLLITSDGHIKVTDFGLSKMGLASLSAAIYEDHLNLSRDQQFTDEQILGTPDYIAPEVILGRAYGFPVDWWSMGVVLYQMLVGITPFASTTVEALFEEITNDNLEIEWPTEEDEEQPPPPVAQNLVEMLLQHEPQQRLGSATLNGVAGVKEHDFFSTINWERLLRQKAQFVPELSGEDDTSYFDTRSDRYHHDEIASDEEDYDDEQYHFPFTNFSTVTHRYSMLELEHSLTEKTADIKELKDSVFDHHNMDPDVDPMSKLVVGLKITTEDGEDPIAVQGTPQEGDALRDGTVTPETPVKDSAPVILAVPSPIDGRNRRQGLYDITVSTGLSPEHPITVTPPTPAADYTLSESNNFSSSAEHGFSLSPVTDDDMVPPLRSPRMSTCEVPYYIQKGEHGYGVVLQSVRVYLAENSDKYRLHHFVQHVDEESPAWEAGLRPGFVITHVNGESVTGLLHVQVVQLMLNNRRTDVLTINAIPLENTTIQTGHRVPSKSIGHRMVKKLKKLKQKTGALKKRSRTIFRTSKDSRSRPQSPPSGSPNHAHQSPRRSEGASRSDSFKETMKRISRIGSPRKPISPLAHSPSPTSVMTTRSRSTSPLTVAHGTSSPSSSPTGSNLYLHEMEAHTLSRKAPERSSSLHSALPKKIQSPTRPERRSWFGELGHSRRPSCEGISSLVTAANKSSPIHQKVSPHGSPLVLQRTVESGKGSKGSGTLSGIKPMRSHSEHLTWKERTAWFNKQ